MRGTVVEGFVRLYTEAMKTTIEIPDEEMEEVLRHTGVASRPEAVVIALAEFNRKRRLEKLVERFGTLDGFMTREELAQLRGSS